MAAVSQADLTDFDASQLHLTPVFLACRDHGVRCEVAKPGSGAVAPGGGSPRILLISDDDAGRPARGPAGFHRHSLRQCIAQAGTVLVSVGIPNAADYFAASAVAAVLRQDAIIIETRVEQEIPWLEFVGKANASIQIVASTATGGGGQQ